MKNAHGIVTNADIMNLVNRLDEHINVNTGYHSKESFVCGLYDTTAPATRVEIWNMPTRIDVYVGNITEMYAHFDTVCNSESDITDYQLKVSKSKNELCAKFYSLKRLEIMLSRYMRQEKQEVQNVTTTKATTKSKSKTTSRKSTKAKAKTA